MWSRCATGRRPDAARGAALLMTLLLLGILALLGTSAMQSAALDLAMSGNEQFRSRALQAAEAGIETALVQLRATAPGAVPAALNAQPMPGLPGDSWSSAVRYVVDDPDTAAASNGTRSGQHYTIASSGSAPRGAAVALEAGVLVVRDAGGAVLAVERRYWKRRDVD
jgi:Tfp pilus assembly protein PilX